MQSVLSGMDRHELVALLEIAERAMQVANFADFRALFRTLQEIVPVARTMTLLYHTDEQGRYREIKKLLNIDFPEEWAALYLDNSLIEHDPIAKRHFERLRPQIWSETLSEPQSAEAQQFIEQWSEYGLSQGITVGQAAPGCLEASLFYFQGDKLGEDPLYLATLEYLTPFLHHSLSNACESMVDESCFTSRERQILGWVLSGKINWEIASILQISERTVKFHIQRAMTKVGAASRSHLVAIAIKKKLIEL